MTEPDPSSRSPIIAAFSPEAAAREPLEFGLAASRFTGAPLVIVVVRHGGPLVSHVAGDVSQSDDARTIEHLREGLRRRGLRDVEVREIDDRTAAGGLEKARDELDPELIVVGSTKRGAVGRALLGSTAERVIHSSSCPVAVVPNGYEAPEGGVQVVGVAFAASDEGREALHAGAVLARAGGVRLRVITVLHPEHAGDQAGLLAGQHHDSSVEGTEAARGRLSARDELRAAVSELAEGVEVEEDVLVNDAADGLIAASGGVDLLVMGSRGLGPKRAVLLGSVSRKVVDGAACPVLVLPRGASAKSEALLADAEAQAALRQ